MEIKACPHCGIRVCPTADGQCPSCRRSFEEEAGPHDETPSLAYEPVPNRDEGSPPPDPSPPEPESTSPYAGLARKIRPQGSAALAEHLSKDPVVVISRSEEDFSTRGGFLTAVNLYRLAATSLDFRVMLDSELVANLAEGQRFETTVKPGEHIVWVSNALASSNAATFTVQNGQRVRFACHGKTTGLLLRRID